MSLVLLIIGRPNVGKSTLFNRLVGRRLALVHDQPGVTRDYREGAARLGGTELTVIDTAGTDFSGNDEFATAVRDSTSQALKLADICLLVIDARAGVLPHDREIAGFLRRIGKPTLLAANKCEGRTETAIMQEAYELGLGAAIPISAEHGDGIGALTDDILSMLPDCGEDASSEETGTPVKIAVVGRPNSGKSSLVNRIVGHQRMLTGSTPGLTRDSISVRTEWAGLPVRIFDTAGMRKRGRITENLEKLSVADSLRAIRFAEVVLLVLDSRLSVESQDLRIADLIEQEGRSIVIAANKWDLVRERRKLREELEYSLAERLPGIRGVGLVPISALTGMGISRLRKEVETARTKWNHRVGTSQLNRWLQEMKTIHPPPAPQGRRIKLKYMTQIKTRPPSFVIMCSRPDGISEQYIRFLKNGLRESFDLTGTPIRVSLRSHADKNPYV
ncbi:MAG: ribosome biogenesis GTPase Der [Rhodobacteraceae bacterium]|nr:ribosome biogenesis GTPase Der [Paracoccaceae bacterium]